MADILATIKHNKGILGYLIEINENSFMYKDAKTVEKDVSWGKYEGYTLIDHKVKRIDKYLVRNWLYKFWYRKTPMFKRKDIPFFSFQKERLDTGMVNISVSRTFNARDNVYYLDCFVVSTNEVAVLDVLFLLNQDDLCIVTKVYDYGFRCKLSLQKLIDMETKGYIFYVDIDAIKYHEEKIINMRDKDIAFVNAFDEWVNTHNSGVIN